MKLSIISGVNRMSKQTIIILILFFLITSFSYSQRYPVPILPGETLKIIKKNKTYNIPLKSDTLWVLKNSQLQNAIIKAKKLELSEDQIAELRNQIRLYKEKGTENDSLISVFKTDRDYYENTWKGSEKDIIELGKINKRQSLYKKIAMAGIPIAFVIGLVVGL